jgi:hypothetical protein
VNALIIGWRDGIAQPYDLTMGMTYDSPVRQWLYDQASILAQRIGRVRDAWRRGEGQ